MTIRHDWHTPDGESVYCRRCDARAGSASGSISCPEDSHTPPLVSSGPPPGGHHHKGAAQ